MSSIGIGLIGCGDRLRSIARGVLEADERIAVTALCDRDPDAVGAARRVLGADRATLHDDARALAADPAVTWVLVGSINCYHREHVIAAIEAGKDVFAEKPLATTLDDALAIRDAHARSGRRFFIGFTLRYTPHFRRVAEIVRGGGIGEIVSMEFNETLDFNHGGFIHQDWRRRTEWAGTHLLEKCCHDLDVMNWLLGGARAARVASFGGLSFFRPENAHHAARIGPHPQSGRPAFRAWPAAAGDPFTGEKDIVDNQVAIVEYDNAVRATFHTNACAAQPERRCYIVGAEGTIRADLVAGRLEHKRLGWGEPAHEEDTSSAGGHGGGDEVLCRELAACIADGAAPPTGLDEGLASAITAFGIDRAMETGQVVDMAPYWQRAGEG